MNRPWFAAYGDTIPQEIDANAPGAIVAMMDETVATYGDLPALECFGTTMSYAELDRQATASTPGGYFPTGDIGESCFVKMATRKKNLVPASRFNVYLNDIEAVVSAGKGAAECAETGEALRVSPVRQARATATDEDVIVHCRIVPNGYQIPRQIVFLDALPKSNVGKILRREPRDQA